MELHLLLGVVNHMFKGLIQVWPEVEDWPSDLHVNLQQFHSGHFNGNDCHKLLRNIDLLQRQAERASAFQAMVFIETFRKFKQVVSACFGHTLDSAYRQKIEEFKGSYLTLPISVTPKVHAVFHHVAQFLNLKQKSLGMYSKQATESMHSSFKKQWQKYQRTSTHPDYKSQLFKCIVDFNSKHL